MKNLITTAVLGSTGYVGLELINILSKHPNVRIVFLGSNNFPGEDIRNFDNRIKDSSLPTLELIVSKYIRVAPFNTTAANIPPKR